MERIQFIRKYLIPIVGFVVVCGIGLVVIVSLSQNKKNTDNRSKAASDGTYEIKLVNRPVGSANNYFLFDGIVENGLTIQQDSDRFTYAGAGWTRNGALAFASGGSASYTGTSGDSVTFRTTASQVVLNIYKNATNYGAFDVYIDGSLRQTVLINTGTGGLATQTIQVIPPVGAKFVQFVNRPLDASNGGFIFDALSDGGAIFQQDLSSKFFFTGTSWVSFAQASTNGGSALYTNQADAAVGFFTTSNQVTLYTNRWSTGYGAFDVFVDGKYKQTITVKGSPDTWNYPITVDVSAPSIPAGSKLVKLVNRGAGSNLFLMFDGIIEGTTTYEQNNDTHNRFFYSGPGWVRTFSNAAPSGGSANYTGTVGDSVSFYTTAQSLKLLTYKGPGYGAFDVYIDGQLQETIVVTSTTGQWRAEVLLSLASPPAGSKTVKLINKAVGTNATFILDAIQISGETIQETDGRIRYIGAGWNSFANTSLNGGTAKYTTVAGDGISFTTTTNDLTALVYKAATGAGAFDVYVDGVYKQTVLLYSATTYLSSPVDFSIGAQPAGSKLVKLVNKGAGTSNFFMFDAIAEGGSFKQDLDAKQIQLAGSGWAAFASSAANGGTAIYTGTVGDSVSFYTTASESTIYSYRGQSYGAFDVYVDGQLKQTVFVNTTSTAAVFQAQYPISYTQPAGTKLVKLVNKPVGTNTYMLFDGITENGVTIQQNDKRFIYSGTGWMGEYIIASAAGGSAAYTGVANDTVSFYTSASSIEVITFKNPVSYGSIDVFIDGVFTQNISLSASASQWNAKVPVQVSAVAATPTPVPTTAPTATPVGGQTSTSTKQLNVLELRYYTSPSNNSGYVTYHNAVSQAIQTRIENASKYHWYKNPQAIPLLDVVVKATVSRYRQFPNTNNNPVDSIKTAVADTSDGNNICNLITTNNIDQIWLFLTEGDMGGFHDISSTFHYKIGPDSLCGGTRSVAVINSLHAHDEYPIRNANEVSLHAFGHFVESQLTGLLTPDLFINQFTGSEYISNTLMRDVGLGHGALCGNIHWAPNTPIDQGYVLWSTAVVNSNCEDWKPNGAGVKTNVTCTNWNACPVNTAKTLDFYEWWFNNMPGLDNTITYNGKQMPPWLGFFADYDATLAYYGRRSDIWHINTPFLYSLNPALTLPLSIDSFSKALSNTGSNLSWSHTSSSIANRLLVVVIGYGSDLTNANGNGGRVQSVTYAGQGLTQARKDYNNLNTEIWFLPNPPTSGTVQVTYGGGNIYNSIASALTIGGVDLTSPVKKNADNVTYGTGTGNPNSPRGAATHSLSIPSAAGDLVIGAYASYGAGNDVSPGSTTQLVMNEKNSASVLFVGLQKTSGTSGTVSWTNTDDWFWSASGVSINLQ